MDGRGMFGMGVLGVGGVVGHGGGGSSPNVELRGSNMVVRVVKEGKMGEMSGGICWQEPSRVSATWRWQP